MNTAKTITIKDAKEEFKPIKRLYAIRDEKEGIVEVMFQPNDMIAIRNFANAVNTENTLINKYPDDYSLMKLGNVEEDGTIIEDKRLIAEANDYRGGGETK